MNYWVQSSTWGGVDFGVLEESALAMAQSTIQNAIGESRISRSELARRMQCDRSFVSRMLKGSHNLTVRTMARSLAACGFEVRFQPIRIEWGWVEPPRPSEEELPAERGQYHVAAQSGCMIVPALN